MLIKNFIDSNKYFYLCIKYDYNNIYFPYRSNSDPDSTKKPCSSPLLDGNTFAAFKNSGLDRACSMKTGIREYST